ncbi:hypothetical protein [Methanosarcina sp.]|uniref:hypothetical protein n=1 Tax=Methanosarcina sp. TaxID=2213 RepID=UPI003C722D65
MEINRWSWEGKRSEKTLSRPGMWDVMGVSESPMNKYELLVYNCTCFDFFVTIRGFELYLCCTYLILNLSEDKQIGASEL